MGYFGLDSALLTEVLEVPLLSTEEPPIIQLPGGGGATGYLLSCLIYSSFETADLNGHVSLYENIIIIT